jgi:hypothetical protein
MVVPINWKLDEIPEATFAAPGVKAEVIKLAEWFWRFYGMSTTWTSRTVADLAKLDPTAALSSAQRSAARLALLQGIEDALVHSGFRPTGGRQSTTVQ